MDRIAKLDNKLNKIDSYNRVVGKYFINMQHKNCFSSFTKMLLCKVNF